MAPEGRTLAPVAAAALAVLAGYALCAAAAPWLSPHDPLAMDTAAALSGPSAAHWLGTDQFGRDLWSRLLFGARLSLGVAGGAVALALAAGVTLGAVAGWRGGWVDMLLSRLTDALFSFPDIFLALVLMAILGQGAGNVALAIAIVYTPTFARVARGSTLEVRGRPFVEAARASGAGPGRLLVRHVLPNIAAPLLVQTTLALAFAVLAEAALSFLGLGVSPDAPSWGAMLAQAKDWMQRGWWLAVFPGVAISGAVLALNLAGDGLRDALDPGG